MQREFTIPGIDGVSCSVTDDPETCDVHVRLMFSYYFVARISGEMILKDRDPELVIADAAIRGVQELHDGIKEKIKEWNCREKPTK